MFPNLFRQSRRKNRSVAAALTDETWIKDLMHDVTPDMLGEYIMLWMLIDEVAFDPTNQQSDEITWTRTANGEYSASSAYLMQFQGYAETNFRSLIWQVWAPSKVKFFVWLILQNRVWTVDRYCSANGRMSISVHCAFVILRLPCICSGRVSFQIRMKFKKDIVVICNLMN
jgi:hypothetical protein